MKTIKNNKHKLTKLFNKYDKNKTGKLSEKQILNLIFKEYKEVHNKNIVLGLMNIWGTKKNNKLYITKDTFINKLFVGDGFLSNKY